MELKLRTALTCHDCILSQFFFNVLTLLPFHLPSPRPPVQDFWVVNNSIQSTIILLIEQIVVALGGEFKLYLPQLIPHMLRVFMHDSSSTRNVSTKVSGEDTGGCILYPGLIQTTDRPSESWPAAGLDKLIVLDTCGDGLQKF